MIQSSLIEHKGRTLLSKSYFLETMKGHNIIGTSIIRTQSIIYPWTIQRGTPLIRINILNLLGNRESFILIFLLTSMTNNRRVLILKLLHPFSKFRDRLIWVGRAWSPLSEDAKNIFDIDKKMGLNQGSRTHLHNSNHMTRVTTAMRYET